MEQTLTIIKIAQSLSPIGIIAILVIIVFELINGRGILQKIRGTQAQKYPEIEDHYNEMKTLTAQNKKLLENHFQHEIPDMVRDLSEIKTMVGEQGQRLTRVETLVEVLREK